MANKGKDWTRDEVVIVYYYLVKNHYSKSKADTTYLSGLFGRSFGSVDWKLSNLISFDTNGSNQDKEIVTYYGINKDKLEIDAAEALSKIKKPNSISFEIPRFKIFPDDSGFLSEGARIKIIANRYERDPKLRKQAIQIHGLNCMVCGFNFKDEYGELGDEFIEPLPAFSWVAPTYCA